MYVRIQLFDKESKFSELQGEKEYIYIYVYT